MRKLKLLLLLLTFGSTVLAQFIAFGVDIPINTIAKDANANGYFNRFTNEIILEQQNNSEITRLLYDSSFAFKSKYINSTKEITLGSNKKKESFLKHLCTEDGNFEVYLKKKKLDIYKLNFAKSIDEKVGEIELETRYKHEKVVSLFAQKNRICVLTYNIDFNVLIYYEYYSHQNKTVIKDFQLPKRSLTEQEIKDRGLHIAFRYDEDLAINYTADLKHVDKFEINTGNQLFYDESHVFMLLPLRYKAGIHILELNTQLNTIEFKNFILNSFEVSGSGTARDRIPMATACDSFLIIKNSSSILLQYYIYNIYNKNLLAFHSKSKDSLEYIVQSKLTQMGTFGSKDEAIEIADNKQFLRKVSESEKFVKAFKDYDDSLVITFGGYKYTEGVEGLALSFMPIGFLGVAFSANDGLGFLFYLSSSRNKFLYAHSKFSTHTFEPSKIKNLTTKLDNLIKDKLIDDLERNSSFAIEVKDKLYIGIFNKKKSAYTVYAY